MRRLPQAPSAALNPARFGLGLLLAVVAMLALAAPALAVSPPVVSVPQVSGITTNGAKFSGSVEVEASADPEVDASCVFQYQGQKSFEEAGNNYNNESRRVHCNVEPITGSEPQPVAVEATLTDLQPSTEYRFQLIAINAGGNTTVDAASTFTTLTAKPLVTASPVVEVGASSATLTAYVDPLNSGLSGCRFLYGPTSLYGQEAPCASIPTGHVKKPVLAAIAGLSPSSTYHYKLVATNSAGSNETADRTFTTLSGAEPPAEGCANEVIRAQQLSTFLPSCRAWEMVSPTHKSGATLALQPSNAPSQPIVSAVTADGNKAAFWAYAAFGNAQSANQNSYLATRTAGGWSTDAIVPGLPQPGINIEHGKVNIVGATPDLTRFFGRTGLPFDPKDERPNIEDLPLVGTPDDIYAVSPGGQMEWISRPDGFVADDTEFGSEWVGASDDGRHVFFQSKEPLVAAATGTIEGSNLFERFEGHTRLVGVDSAGVALSECGSAFGPYNYKSDLFYQGSVSADGSRVYVTSPDPRTSACSEKPHVYLRSGNQTIDASRSRRSVPDPDPAPVSFQGASKDGSVAYILTDEALTKDANPSAWGMLYEYDANSDQLKLVATNAIGVSALAPDGSRVYYQTGPYSATTGVTGDLYAYSRADGQTHLVTANVNSDAVLHEGFNSQTRTTPDGRYLIFPSTENVTGYDSHGIQQLYRYDAVADEVRCVSCDPDGSPPTGPAYLGSAAGLDGFFAINRILSRNISSDGSRALFETRSAISDADVNGVSDVYEWHNGQISLVSDGKAERGSYFLSMSEDGRDAFFSTRQSLLKSDIDNGDADLYDARIGGGFAEPVPPAPCQGEGCQGQAGVLPQAGTGTTNSFNGPPNKTERKAQKHKKKKKKRHTRKAHNGKAAKTTKKGR